MTINIQRDNALYMLLREGNMEEFNKRVSAGENADFKFCDFRNVDLRGMEPGTADFSGCYFRQADLRGVDLSQANLRGASINNAKISGTLFPQELTAPEITLSHSLGTRMRY